MDCTPWVLGGLWPAELNQPAPETASLAEYLRNDLHRIADSANQKLREIGEAALPEPIRQAEEARVINVARAFAVLRVESTIRHLRQEPLGFQPEYLSLGVVPEEPTRVVRRDQPEPTVVIEHEDPAHRAPVGRTDAVTPEPPAPPGVVEMAWADGEPVADAVETPSPSPAVAPAQEQVRGAEEVTPVTPDPAATSSDLATPPAFPAAASPAQSAPPKPRPDPAAPAAPSRPAPARAPGGPRHAKNPVGSQVESADSRLRRLLTYVARQEPGLAWAVGDRADGSTVLVTDVAHGWIPPGVKLPAGVELLLPQRRRGNLTNLMGPTGRSLTYRPGDAFAPMTELDVTVPSAEVRRAEVVPDLGWQLTEATHWRDGLPRMVHTMAKAGAAGTGVVDAELDVLRVHLDTARYQLFSQYPDINDRLFCNCLLLAATEAIAVGDQDAANYHFAWYLEMTTAGAGSWGQQP